MSASCPSFVSRIILEHELVSNSDSGHMIDAVSLKSSFDNVTLPLVYSNIIRYDVVTEIDLHIGFGLLNRFQLWK